MLFPHPWHNCTCRNLRQSKLENHTIVSKFKRVKRRLVQTYYTSVCSLRTLLSDATIIDQIEQSEYRVRKDGTLQDFCDGKLFRLHPVFSQDPQALQIIAFYDDLELCNSLGTCAKKHKLGILLLTLGNIDPKFRSSLRVMHLVIAAAAPVIEKHGIDAMMEPYVQDLKSLATQGIVVSVNGIERTFRGALLAFLAHNLASHVFVASRSLFHLPSESAGHA